MNIIKCFTKFSILPADNDKTYPFTKDPCVPKYQLQISIGEKIDLKPFKEPKASIEDSNFMKDFYPRDCA